MPRLRFSLRWMMLSVLIAAALVWAWKMRRLSMDYSRQAASFEAEETFWDSGVTLSDAKVARRTRAIAELRDQAKRDFAEGLPESAKMGEIMVGMESDMLKYDREDSRVRRQHREESARLARKYRRAARYPWLSIEPDRPGPD